MRKQRENHRQGPTEPPVNSVREARPSTTKESMMGADSNAKVSKMIGASSNVSQAPDTRRVLKSLRKKGITSKHDHEQYLQSKKGYRPYAASALHCARNRACFRSVVVSLHRQLVDVTDAVILILILASWLAGWRTGRLTGWRFDVFNPRPHFPKLPITHCVALSA